MKESIENRLITLKERHEELAAMLSESSVIADNALYRRLSIEYSRLEPLVQDYRDYQQQQQEKNAAQLLRSDPDLRELADNEISIIDHRLEQLENRLKTHLIPVDPHDTRDCFLEIRAGSGGDEAALFAGDLFRMYSRYAEQRGWRLDVLSASEGEHGGFKEIISRISGQSVYSRLKFESGAHRVQRVPTTESQGRIHTSAATVAIIPVADDIEAPQIESSDLRIDTFRASGAGGQHVNKTDSAIRITHLPTGIVVECQDERSQHKNKARAMSLLASRLLEMERRQHQEQEAATRKSLVGSGDRSERIRTYNFPQGRITDHRINLTLYKLDDILNGQLDELLDALTTEHQSEQLAEMGLDQ